MFKNMTKKQRNAIIAAAALMFAYGLMNNTLGFFVTPVSEAIGCSRAAFNLYYTIMSIVSLVVSPVFGQLLVRIPIRKILLVGCVIGAVGFVAFSMCSAIPFFYVIAVVVGLIQNGCTSVSAVVVVNRAYDGNAGSATGFAMAGTGICSVIASLVLPTFIGSMGWRAGYLLQAVVWIVMLIIAMVLCGDDNENNISENKKKNAEEPEVKLTGATYAQALKSPVLYLLMFVIFVLNIGAVFVQHMPSFFVELGTSAVTSGMIMSIFSIFLIICKIGLGILFDKLGAEKTVLLAYLSFALGFWVMAQGSLVCMCIGAAMEAFGMASSTVLTPLITGKVFGRKEYAPIWSTVTMATALGCAVGSPLWGFVYDILGSYKLAVMIVPFFVIAGGLILLFMLKKEINWDM